MLKQQHKPQKPSSQNSPKPFKKASQKPIKKQKQIKTESTPNPTEVKKNKKVQGNEQLPTIQTMLEIAKDDRENKTTQYFKKIRPFLESYMQKKIGSRVIQLMYKWGTADVKSQIHKAILQNWKDLIRSKYALHAISKVSGDFEFPRLAEDAIILQNNKQGSMLLQNFINKHHGSPKCQEIFNKFESMQKQQGEKGLASQQILHNLAMKSIQKMYYGNKVSKLIIRLAFSTMIEGEKQKVIEFFADKAFELIADDQGVKLFVLLFNYLTTKQKKAIIKSFEGRVDEILRMCKISYVALIKILTETDDTVIVANHLIPELLQGLTPSQNQMQNEGEQGQNAAPQHNIQKLLSILISLLSPRNNNFNCLGKIEKNVVFTTCKKPEEKRKQEVRAIIYPTLVEYVCAEGNLERVCTDPHESKIILGLIKSMEADGSDMLKTLCIKILKHFITNLQSSTPKKPQISKSLASTNFGSKVLKNILLLHQPYIDKYCDKFAQLFKTNLNEALHCNASFVVTVLIERGREELLDEIRRARIDFSGVKAAEFYLGRIKGGKTK